MQYLQLDHLVVLLSSLGLFRSQQRALLKFKEYLIHLMAAFRLEFRQLCCYQVNATSSEFVCRNFLELQTRRQSALPFSKLQSRAFTYIDLQSLESMFSRTTTLLQVSNFLPSVLLLNSTSNGLSPRSALFT